MAMNWGGFAGGLSQGFNNGMAMGKSISEAMKERQMQDIRSQGMAEAEAQRASDVNKRITDNGAAQPDQPAQPAQIEQIAPQMAASDPNAPAQSASTPVDVPTNASIAQPAAAPIAAPVQNAAPASAAPVQPGPTAAGIPVPASMRPPAQKRFMVGERGFDNRAEAEKHVDTLVAPMADYMMNTILPKQQKAMIESGNLEGAEKLGQYMDSRKGREAQKSFGKAMAKLLYTNDVNGGVQALGDYYTKHIDDGVDFVKGRSDGKGSIVITVKNKESGEESERSMTRQELVQMGMAHDPVQVFKMQADLAKADAATAADVAKEKRGEGRDIRKEGRDEIRKLQREGRDETRDDSKSKREQTEELERMEYETQSAGGKVKRDYDAKVDILRSAGQSDDAIRALVPEMVGVGGHKKTTDREERRALIASDFSKNNSLYNREKDPAKRRKMIDDEEDAIRLKAAPAPAPAAAPAGRTAPAGKSARPGLYNPATGKVEHR